MSASGIRAGWIGIGDIGGPMAGHVIRSGIPTTVYSRSDARLRQYDGLPFERAATPAELAGRSDVVGICVFDDDDVRDVIAGADGVLAGLRPGGVVVVHSTVHDTTVIGLEGAVADSGCRLLDAPISGMRSGAEHADLAIMVGGDPTALLIARPMIETYAGTIHLLGAVGAGQRAKLLNNALMAANLTNTRHALDTGIALGLDPEELVRVFRGASGASYALEVLTGRIMTDPDFALHSSRMRRDNIDRLRAVCAAAGIAQTPMESAAAAALDIVLSYARR